MSESTVRTPAHWIWAILAVTVVLIIVIAAVVTRPRTQDHENYLTGFWIADPDFLRKADLDDMYLYLEPPEPGVLTKRQGYLVMTNRQGEFVSNQGLEVTYGPSLRRWWDATRTNFSQEHPYVIPQAQFGFDDEGFRAAMPEQMSMTLSRADGSLALHDDEKVYAFFWKDTQVSASVADREDTM